MWLIPILSALLKFPINVSNDSYQCPGRCPYFFPLHIPYVDAFCYCLFLDDAVVGAKIDESKEAEENIEDKVKAINTNIL